MPLWALFTLSYFILIIAAGSSLAWYIISVLQHVTAGDVYNLVTLRAAGLVVLIFLLQALIFLILNRVIARPLRSLAQSMKSYAADGTQIAPEVSRTSPKEIRIVSDSFIKLATAMGSTHKHDAEMARVKSDFISTAAHQLRTPLTGIRWSLEALERGNPTEEQKALIQSAVEKSHELVAIVGTLLDISAIESGKYKYQFAQVDLPNLLEEVTRDFAQMAKERNLSLIYHGSETPVPPARADRERIKWVLNNLVENALRYTPAGGSVRLMLTGGAGTDFIKVRDTGIGILPKDRQNIFERFYRGSNAIATENEGNGLGLYIARTIATDHGGDLTFEGNTDGPGTTFTLSLPAA